MAELMNDAIRYHREVEAAKQDAAKHSVKQCHNCQHAACLNIEHGDSCNKWLVNLFNESDLDTACNGVYLRTLQLIKECKESNDWFTISILEPYMSKALAAFRAGNFVECMELGKTLEVLVNEHYESGNIFGD